MKLLIKHIIVSVVLFTLISPVLVFAADSITTLQQDGVPVQHDDNFGWVDWLEGEQIVIEDTQYVITSKTKVFDVADKTVSSNHLKTDMFVNFYADEGYKLIYIKENPLVDKDGEKVVRHGESQDLEPQAADITPPEIGTPAEIFKQGGVWRN